MLWALGDSRLLGQQSREVIASQDHTVMVSIASLWECAIKSSLGKLELPEDFFTALPEAGYEVLPIEVPHLIVYQSLPMHHRDPFDRLLIAQAKSIQAILITRDDEIMKYDVEILSC